MDYCKKYLKMILSILKSGEIIIPPLKNILDEIIESDSDGIVLASIFGTNRLQKQHISWQDNSNLHVVWKISITTQSRMFKPFCQEIIELKIKNKKKISWRRILNWERNFSKRRILEKRNDW